MAALVSANNKTHGSNGHAATSTTLLRRVMRFDFDQLASSALSLVGELLYDHAKALRPHASIQSALACAALGCHALQCKVLNDYEVRMTLYNVGIESV